MPSLLQDFRRSLRALASSPRVGALAILTIAIGIGSSTTIFSWIRDVLLNPLPGAGHPDRVVELESLTPGGDWVPTSYLDFVDYRTYCKSFSGMSVTQPIALAVGNEMNVERVWGEVVSGNFFDLLEVKPQLGRFFTGPELGDAQNAHPVVVLSDAYWKSHYRADPLVIGAQVRLNQHLYTIIGVAPEGFRGSLSGLNFAMWAPATMYGQLTATGDWMLRDRKTRMFRVLTRLAPGVTLEQARAEVQALAKRMAEADADTNQGMSGTLLPIWKAHYGLQDSLRVPLGILLGACGVMLLIVCANVANLLLARATTQQKEFSIRLALGAPRWRLAQQLLVETSLVAGGGALAGLLIASWMGGALQWLVPRTTIPTIAKPPVDGGVLLFTVALMMIVTVLAGLAPALLAAKENINDVLKEASARGSASGRAKRLRGMLVTVEMALAVVGLVGAGLFLKSFERTREIRPGFDPNHVALAQLNLSAAGYTAEQADTYCRRLREQFEQQPGVTAVSYADYIPLSVAAGSWEDLQIQGYVPGASENMKIYRTLAAPGYFQLLRIPLLEGRDFDLRDNRSSDPVMIVNQEFVRRFLPNQNPLGRKVHGWGKWFTIVGVVQDSKIYRLTEAPAPYFYVPIRQIYRPEMGLAFYVRTAGPEASAIASIRQVAQADDPAVPVFDAASMNDYIAESLFGERIAASLLTVLDGIAVLLAAIGLYSVMGYSVAQRTNEIGIRVALGAQPRDVLRLIVWEGLMFAVAGLAVGFLAAMAMAKTVSAALFGVSPLDPGVYAAVTVFTLVVAFASTIIPAVHGMRIDPVVALRQQ
jgi:predicted permease